MYVCVCVCMFDKCLPEHVYIWLFIIRKLMATKCYKHPYCGKFRKSFIPKNQHMFKNKQPIKFYSASLSRVGMNGKKAFPLQASVEQIYAASKPKSVCLIKWNDFVFSPQAITTAKKVFPLKP